MSSGKNNRVQVVFDTTILDFIKGLKGYFGNKDPEIVRAIVHHWIRDQTEDPALLDGLEARGLIKGWKKSETTQLEGIK